MSDESNIDEVPDFPLPALEVTAPRFTWNDTFGIKVKSISERIFEYILGPQNPAFIHATLNHQDIRNGYTLAYNPNGILWRVNAAGDPHPDDLYSFYQQQDIHQAYADNLSAKFTMIFGTPVAGSNAEVVGMRLSQVSSKAKNIFGRETSEIMKASELREYAQSQGWTKLKTETGPEKWVDKSGVERITIKQGSSRAPGSENPHVEIKDASGQRIDPMGNPVTRKSSDNHTPIDFDIE
ncbi:hypothetical protein [Sporomusa sp.]|jgi:hypothetical protein|uniref:hypothetical protein n=1 Tax=Sporomusa sp. TaxID=2078658 RepID=UPI002BD73E51|nr:hypothetical protein [Sporomusa sp.]HWR09902.1 hypothetical protein [Sporomusa sp.]